MELLKLNLQKRFVKIDRTEFFKNRRYYPSVEWWQSNCNSLCTNTINIIIDDHIIYYCIFTGEIGEKQQVVVRLVFHLHNPRSPPVQVSHQREQPRGGRPGRPGGVQQVRVRVDQTLVEPAVERSPNVHTDGHVVPPVRHVGRHALGKLSHHVAVKCPLAVVRPNLRAYNCMTESGVNIIILL